MKLEESYLLRHLPKVRLARLLPEVHELVMESGDQIDLREAGGANVYIIGDGLIELVGDSGGEPVVLDLLSPGDSFAEESLVESVPEYRIHAVTAATLHLLPSARLQSLMQAYPAVSREVLQRVFERLGANQRELLRTRAGLRAYGQQVWGEVENTLAGAGQAAAVEPELTPDPEPEPEPDPAAEPATDPWRLLRGARGMAFLGSFLISGLLLWLLPRTGMARTTVMGTAALAWSLINWTFDTMPDYVVGLAATAIVVALGVAPASVALSGFANTTWFLSLAVLGIGTAISQSGLLFRTALHMLRLLPATYWGQALALAISGLFLTPVLPSPSGRIAISSPLVTELAEAMRLKPHSRGTAGLGMSVLLGFGQMYFMFLNGTGSCILLWNLLPGPVRAHITWAFWLLAALPLGFVVFVGSFLAILWLYHPERRVTVNRNVVLRQLEMLGPLSKVESVTLVTVSLVLLAFITQPLHGIDPTWVGLAGLVYLLATDVIDRGAFRRTIDWNFLMLYGVLIGMASILEYTKVDKLINAQLAVVFHPFLTHPVVFLLVVALATTLVRVAVPMVAASLMMAVALYPLAPLVGINPFLITLAVQVASNPWFLPHQNTFYQTTVAGTDGMAFTHKQVRNLAFIYAAFTILAVPLSAPWWKWLGLM